MQSMVEALGLGVPEEVEDRGSKIEDRQKLQSDGSMVYGANILVPRHFLLRPGLELCVELGRDAQQKCFAWLHNHAPWRPATVRCKACRY